MSFSSDRKMLKNLGNVLSLYITAQFTRVSDNKYIIQLEHRHGRPSYHFDHMNHGDALRAAIRLQRAGLVLTGDLPRGVPNTTTGHYEGHPHGK